jgi:predicted nucleic acid-binding protein
VKYLVDSDWLIDAIGGIPYATQSLDALEGGIPAISIVSSGELCDGAAHAADPDLEIARIRQFLGTFKVLGLDDATMEIFARARAHLRRRGQMIPDFDLLIASTALQHDLTLLTRNIRHFSRVPDLILYLQR